MVLSIHSEHQWAESLYQQVSLLRCPAFARSRPGEDPCTSGGLIDADHDFESHLYSIRGE